MSLRINPASSGFFNVQTDLLTIAGTDAPKISIASSGEVTFHSAPRDFPGGTLIANLYDDPGIMITIHGANGNTMQVVGEPGVQHPAGTATQPLCGPGMYWSTPGVSTGVPPATVDVDLVYDPTGAGGPYVGYDPSGAEIPAPSATILVFLLAAAGHYYGSSYHRGTSPWLIPVDVDACLAVENNWRLTQFLPERKGARDLFGKACSVKPHKRASTPPKNEYKGKVYTLPKCFVATAAYGSPLANEVDFLRSVRDDVLARTPAGNEFFSRFHEHYYRFSPELSSSMLADEDLAQVVRQALVEPLVHWLEVAIRMPDAPVDDVPEPWASFIENLKSTVESWASEIARPHELLPSEGISGVRELAVMLKFILRTADSREAFLSRLEESGCLPLAIEPHEAAQAKEIFAMLERPDIERERVLGAVAARSSEPEVVR